MNNSLNYWVAPSFTNSHKPRSIQQVLFDYCVLVESEPSHIKKKSRKADIILKRQMFHYIAHQYCGFSCTSVGKLTNVDHSTVLHSCKKINDLMYLPMIKKEVSRITPYFFIEHQKYRFN